jgi:membrane protease YdiL (CAAX protease family)
VIAGIVYQVVSLGLLFPLLLKITGQSPEVSDFSPIQGDLAILLVALLASWTIAAFLEEFVFRGYLFNRIADFIGHGSVGWMLGLVLSAAAFGGAHAYQGIQGMLDNFVFGLILGGLFLASRRSLWAPVIAHGVYDTIGFLFIFLGMYP